MENSITERKAYVCTSKNKVPQTFFFNHQYQNVSCFKRKFGFNLFLNGVLMTNKSNTGKSYWKCSNGCGARLKGDKETLILYVTRPHTLECEMDIGKFIKTKAKYEYIGGADARYEFTYKYID